MGSRRRHVLRSCDNIEQLTEKANSIRRPSHYQVDNYRNIEPIQNTRESQRPKTQSQCKCYNCQNIEQPESQIYKASQNSLKYFKSIYNDETESLCERKNEEYIPQHNIMSRRDACRRRSVLKNNIEAVFLNQGHLERNLQKKNLYNEGVSEKQILDQYKRYKEELKEYDSTSEDEGYYRHNYIPHCHNNKSKYHVNCAHDSVEPRRNKFYNHFAQMQSFTYPKPKRTVPCIFD